MRVSVYHSFDDLPTEVRHGLSYPSQPDFQRSLGWYELLFETSLRQTFVPRIYVATGESGQLSGALFCGTTRPRHLTSLTNYYALEYGAPPAAMAAILRHVAAERPRWHSVRLHLLRADAEDTAAAQSELERAGFAVERFFQYENWFTVPDATFEAYFAARPSQVRNTITRKQRKLERTSRVEMRILRGESPELEPTVHDWIGIYESSWKRPEPFPEFIPRLAAECARLGILRLGVLYVDGTPAAGQLWIVAGPRAIIYKLAYDERYREQGVGSILSREMFRLAIDEDRVREIDYGVGSEPYKKDWMSEARTRIGLVAHNRRTVPGAAAVLSDGLRRIVKRARSRS
jgi:ribosomal protein S18 acetylase RimI-like enzyme